MDAFYASVEQRDNPELRGKPVAVGHADERGVVAAASYEARRYGVHSAMSSVKAMRICPDLIFIEGRMNVYKEVSRQIHAIFRDYTDLIEPLSLDEAFLDVTVNKPGIELAVDIAVELKRRIKEELGLVASAGVSFNKFLAKIASDYRKCTLWVFTTDCSCALIQRKDLLQNSEKSELFTMISRVVSTTVRLWWNAIASRWDASIRWSATSAVALWSLSISIRWLLIWWAGWHGLVSVATP